MASLDGPSAKLGRARDYLDTLERHFIAISDLNSYEIISEFDSQAGNYAYRFGKVPPIPADLELLIGDALYNCRACLDHLIWQLVLTNKQVPNTRNEFPIFLDPNKYVSEKNSKLRGVSNVAKAIIDGLQPCNGGLEGLWFLHVLHNTDKHRHLLTQRRAIYNTRVSWTGNRRSPKIRAFDVPVEEGAVFLRADEQMNMDVKPRITIMFTNAPSEVRPTRLPVSNILSMIRIAIGQVFVELRHQIT